MITIDIGNTKTAIGFFEGNKLNAQWKISTVRHRLKDDYKLLFSQIFPEIKTSAKKTELIVSSVVPSATKELVKLEKDYTVHVINYQTPKSFDVVIDQPHTIGPDRIADAEAALKEYGAPVIIVDAGTATTITVINHNKEFIGGMICPGLGISTEALFKSAAALSQIKIEFPEKIIGRSTEKAIQSGICHGHSLMIQGLVNRIKSELPEETSWKVVVTGGTSDFLSTSLPPDYILDTALTLKGLNLLAKNLKEAARG